MTKYYGKYRGKVENNQDPKQKGRVEVSVPAVYDDGTKNWALPCVPYAGPDVGKSAIPPVGANVWVEFEGGEADSPIWTGCFWDRGDAPASPAVPLTKMLKTDGVTIEIDETPGGGKLVIEVGPPVVSAPQKITFGSSGITIEHGKAKIALTQASVSINDGILEVV